MERFGNHPWFVSDQRLSLNKDKSCGGVAVERERNRRKIPIRDLRSLFFGGSAAFFCLRRVGTTPPQRTTQFLLTSDPRQCHAWVGCLPKTIPTIASPSCRARSTCSFSKPSC